MYETLFMDNKGLIWRIARRYEYFCRQSGAVDLDDLLQVGFLGLVQAHATYDAAAGKSWASWAWWYVDNAMRDALGLRTCNGRAALETISMDAPLDDEEGATLGDMQADPTLPDPDESLLRQEMQATVRAAVDALPEGSRAAITLTVMQSMTRAEAAQALHISPDQLRRDIDKAMRCLRLDRQLRALALLEDGTPYWACKGIRAFERDWTSTVEAAVLWRDEWRKRQSRLYNDA